MTKNYIKTSANETMKKRNYFYKNLQKDFLENEIILTLSRLASLTHKIYNAGDFPEVQCESVTDLSSEATAVALGYKTNKLINVEKYRRILLLTLRKKSKRNVLDAINLLKQRDDVISASPNYIKEACNMGTVSDNDIVDKHYALSKIEIEKAWLYSIGTSEIKIGVIDSGIDTDHPDLKNIVLKDLSRDFSNEREEPFALAPDEYGHGTFIAGQIGATGKGGENVFGVCPNIKLVSLGVFNGEKHASNKALILALNYAEKIGLPIVNFSGAGFGIYIEEEAAIRNYSGLYICAAGNQGADNDGKAPLYPASYNLPNIISVGAVDSKDERAVWLAEDKTYKSNYGKNSVDIYAPGKDIYSTTKKRDNDIDYRFAYNFGSGTSFAAPYVTGVAALLLSYNPSLTPIDLKSAIINGADIIEITISDGSKQKVKRLNAFKAMKYVIENYSDAVTIKCNTTIKGRIDKSSPYFSRQSHMLKISVRMNYNYKFVVQASAAVVSQLYDEDLNCIRTFAHYLSGCTTCEFVCNLSPGTYFLKTFFPYEDAIKAVFCMHIYGPLHHYARWKYYSNSKHMEVCSMCSSAGSKKESHYINQADLLNGKRYVRCLGCYKKLDLKNDLIAIETNSSDLKINRNGTYILPSGIVALASKDMKAYLNHTLVFFKHKKASHSSKNCNKKYFLDHHFKS